MEITIRDAVPADGAGLARVIIETTAATFRGLVPEHCLTDLTYEESQANWEKALREDGRDENEFILAAVDTTGQVIGYVMAWHDVNYPTPDSEIAALYVLPDFQRRGVGRHLLQRAAERLMEAGVRSLRVGCLSINPNCLFYERLGAQRLAERERPWAGETFQEIIYGWQDISQVTARHQGHE